MLEYGPYMIAPLEPPWPVFVTQNLCSPPLGVNLDHLMSVSTLF